MFLYRLELDPMEVERKFLVQYKCNMHIQGTTDCDVLVVVRWLFLVTTQFWVKLKGG